MTAAQAQARALLVARILIGVYLVEILLNLTRPRIQDHEPSLTIFQPVNSSSSVSRLFSLPEIIFWALIAGMVIGLVLQFVAARYPAASLQARTLTWVTLGVLLGPFALVFLWVFSLAPLVALACVPSTAFALWLLHRVQQFGRLPVRLLLAAFAWGALFTPGYFRATGNLLMGALVGYLLKNPTGDIGSFNDVSARMLNIVLIQGSIVIALVQAAGIFLLMILVRHRIDDVVSGLVLGAAAGLGFGFSESLLFIHLYPVLGAFNGATAGFEYWIRQSITLPAGSLAFGAVIGASLGIASQLADRRRRLLVAGAGVMAAAGGWLASEIGGGWLAYQLQDGFDQGGALDTLVISPLPLLLFQAPFVALYVILLVVGLRARAVRARVALEAEARTGLNAVTPMEAAILADPALRFWVTMRTGRRLGRPAAVTLRRLHTAQLELAAWRSEQGESIAPGAVSDETAAAREEGEMLRENVFGLKAGLPAAARPAVRS